MADRSSRIADSNMEKHTKRVGGRVDEEIKFAESQNPKMISKNYFESTTTHGLSRIYSASSIYIRCFWLAIFLVVFGLLVSTITRLVLKTTEYNVVTNVQTKFYPGLQFPAITFCNGNPFRESEIKKIYPQNKSKSGSKEFNEEMQIILGQLNDSSLYKVGHPREIFLMKGMDGCFFQNEKCNLTKDFLRLTSPTTGNCFTYKSKDRVQRRASSEAGLFATLNINQFDYAKEFPLSSSAGAKVMVHHSDEAFPETKAIHLVPGTLTDIKIEKKVIKRLKDPYPDNCSDATSMKEAHGIPLRYSIELCQFVCYLDTQAESCGCVTPLFASTLKDALSAFGVSVNQNATNYKIAVTPSQIKCTSQFEEMFESGKITCNCPPPCVEEQFKITVSSSMWPPLNRASYYLYQLQTVHFHEKIFQDWTVENLYQNILAVNIYYKDFTIETVEQKPAYTLDDFASDLGGQLGLWIGASIFSAFELGGYIMNMIAYFLFWRQKHA